MAWEAWKKSYDRRAVRSFDLLLQARAPSSARDGIQSALHERGRSRLHLFLEGLAQLLGVRRMHHRGVESYDSRIDKLLEFTVKILHALGCAVPHSLKQVLARRIMHVDA